MAWSLAATRSVFEHRAVVTGAGRESWRPGLAAVAAGEPAAGCGDRRGPGAAAGRVVFVFPGQGASGRGWAGSWRVLPGVRGAAGRVRPALAPHVDWDLAGVLAGAAGAPGLDAAEVVQPVLWAVMVSLAAVWQAAGVVPDAVVGHSPGRDRGGDRGRDPVAGGRGAGGGGAQPGAVRRWPARAGWCRW